MHINNLLINKFELGIEKVKKVWYNTAVAKKAVETV